jgi:O-antigen ligase
MSKRAHNDYLELLANQGLIGFTLLGLAILLLMIKLYQGLSKSLNSKKKSATGITNCKFLLKSRHITPLTRGF